MNAEAAFERRFALAEYIVGKSDARLGQKLRAIVRQRRVANGGIGVNHAVGEVVIRGATVSFIPSIGRFEAKPRPELESGRHFPCVLDETGSKQGSPS